MINTEKIERIGIRIPKELKEEFFKHCEKNMINSSAVIRSLIEKYLKEIDNYKSPSDYFKE